MRLVSGLGICREGKYPANINRKATKTYTLWSNMIKRCTDAINGPYTGCICHPEFVEFQSFAEWCQTQIGFGVEGFELDKDILIQGNKVYGPDTCCFVPKALNLLLTKNQPKHGLPLGVTYWASRSKYMAKLSINNRTKNLGYFDTPDAAHTAYRTAKLSYIIQMVEFYKDAIDPRIYEALLNYKF